MFKIIKKLKNIKNKIINNKKYILLLPIIMFSNESFAATPSVYGFDGFGDRNTELDMIATLSYSLVFWVGIFLSIFMFFKGITRLLSHGKEPHNPKYSIGGAVILFLGAGLLGSLHGSIGIMVNTMTGSGGHCMMYSDVASIDVNDALLPSLSDPCFDAETSELTSELNDSLIAGGKADAAKRLMHKVNILFGILQTVGLAYFVKGIYTLKSIVENTTQQTYGQVFLMLMMSSLVIDMPNTLLIITETAEKISSIT